MTDDKHNGDAAPPAPAAESASARHKPPVTPGFRLLIWVILALGVAIVAFILLGIFG